MSAPSASGFSVYRYGKTGNKMSRIAMLRVLPPMFKPVSQQVRLLQVAKSCRTKQRVVLLFGTKSVHVARFTDPRQTCLAESDVNPVYDVTPAKIYPIRSQYSPNLQQAGSNVDGKTPFNTFRSMLQNKLRVFVAHLSVDIVLLRVADIK